MNYKTKAYLTECLRSIIADVRDAPEISYNIAVLDNASGDDLSDIKSLFPEADIEVLLSQENLGFGRGHNALANNREERYLLLLNPDTKIIEPHTIARLLKSMEKLAADVLGPRLVTAENKTQRWDHGELNGLFARIALAYGRSCWRERKKPLPVAWVSGAVFLIKNKEFADAGGFDPNFFLYKEEEDLCLRLRQKGKMIFYDPEISVLHYGSVVAKKSEYMEKSRAYFMQKHFGRRR